MKKLEIEKTKPTMIISTFKTDIIKVGLVFSISSSFIAKTSLANNWRSFSNSYLALVISKILQIVGLQPRIQKFFSITRTFISHSRSEQFW